MAALTIAQDEKGWLSDETMAFIARYLDMPPIAVHEVATFYTMYDLEAGGQTQNNDLHQFALCASGANDAAEHLKKKLGIDFNGTTPDGKFTLKEGECLGACGDAPVLLGEQ